MAKARFVLPRLFAASILTAALAGCGNSSTPPAAGPTSPDASQKNPTKNASGTSNPGKTGAAAPGGLGSPKSPDMMAKDPTKSPGVAPIADATATPMKGPEFKDATHTLTENQPYFLTSPAQDAKPDGVLASGSPVLVVIPGADYSKVKIGNGTEAYVTTASLKPMGK